MPHDAEQAAHEFLRPDIQFVKVAVQRILWLHPLPFGLQRSALETLLKEWKWTARPLQPGRGAHLGGSWDVGTTDDPPAPILFAFGKDVLITQVRDRSNKVEPQKIAASRKTQQHMAQHAKGSSSSSSTQDPWTQGDDPWAGWKPTGGPPPPGLSVGPSAQPGAKRIAEVAANIKAEVQAALQQELTAATNAPVNAEFDEYKNSAGQNAS